MAARIRSHHQDDIRAKIQVGNLVHYLHQGASGEVKLSRERLEAIKILLNKVVPDLKAMELTGEGGGPVKMVGSWKQTTSK